MTEIVRRELKTHPGFNYPTEISWTSDGAWTLEDLHRGHWTDRVASPEETPEHIQVSGGRITRDELHYQVLDIALDRGLKLLPAQSAMRESIRALIEDFPVRGTAVLSDPELSETLRRFCDLGLAWLNASVAPTGRRFVLENALYLIED